jgi:ribosomal protein S18 acetylase RimI-like enzyme
VLTSKQLREEVLLFHGSISIRPFRKRWLRKAQWAGNFFLGKRGDHMVIAEHAGGVVGFTQLLNTGDDALVVDLIAVDVNCRGRGVARGMIRYAASMWGLGRPLRVGTQIANTVSLLAYQRMGFRIISSSYVFHHHRTAS